MNRVITKARAKVVAKPVVAAPAVKAATKAKAAAIVETIKAEATKPRRILKVVEPEGPTFEEEFAAQQEASNEAARAALRTATGEAMSAQAVYGTKVASLVACIRACEARGYDKDVIGEDMKLGAIMANLSVDLEAARAKLAIEPRPADVKAVLHTLKTAKSRAYAVKTKEDDNAEREARGEETEKVIQPRGAGKGGAKPASFMGKLDVPAPVNAAALASQLLKARVILKAILEGGKGLEGAESLLRAAKAAIAVLPEKLPAAE